MRRYWLPVLMLAMVGPALAEPLVSVRGELSSRSPRLKSGEFAEVHKVNARTGALVTVSVAAEGFAPYVIVTAPQGQRFSRGVTGTTRQIKLELVTAAAGEYQIVVSSEKAGQTGKFVLEGESRPLQAGLAGLKPLLDHRGEIRDTDAKFSGGRPADTHTVEIEAGQVVRVQAQSAAFDALLAVTPPGATALMADNVQDKDPEIVFLAAQGGTLKIIVAPSEVKGRGPYRLQVTSGPLATTTSTAAVPRPAVLEDDGALGPGSAKLESGEWAALYAVNVTAGQTYLLHIDPQGFQPRLMAALPDGKQVDLRISATTQMPVRLTSERSGVLRFCLASTRSGAGGIFRVSVQRETAVAAGAGTTPTATVPATTATTPADPRVPPPPKFKKNALIDPNSPAFKVPSPKPLPATVQDPGVLAKTLHQMNYLSVEAGGWSEMNEENWLYPRANESTHGPQRLFFTDLDNQFNTPGGGGHYTTPLQWTGNIFTCRHRRNLGVHGGIEMLDVAGTVSPDGNRVEWVTIREYVQETYWHEADKQAYLSSRLYRSISLVDLPLRNIYHNPESGSGKYHHTMQEQLTGSPLELVLKNGFSYGFIDRADAGQHVLDLGYLKQDPAVQGHRYIDADQIHTVAYRSTKWAHPTGRSSAKLIFERRKDAP